MKKELLFTVLMLVFSGAAASEQINYDGDIKNPKNSEPRGICKSLNQHLQSVVTTYNSASTTLSVRFPANSQGGKVEIYRNGTRVVGVKAPAGTSLCYMLRNYGKGEFTIIVSQGNTVIYSNSVIVK